jgi:3-dehydroquinate synthase
LKKVSVKSVLKSYPVYIGNNTFSLLPDLIKKYYFTGKIFVIIDRKVNLYFENEIKQVLKSISDKINFLILAASEKNKSLDSASKIFSILHKEKCGRDTLLIVIGGGTIGDLAGFVASTYMRGVSLVHIPTTLLSMVDSSIGGKSGVNFKSAKNFIGTFYPPSFVVCDTNFLKTLPQAQISSGLGEVIKYSYLTDVEFNSYLLTNLQSLKKSKLDFFTDIIFQCAKIKSAVVSKDEFEKSGLRKILNFGHTFAHAYESISDYKISHGKAVIIGILNALHLSAQMGLISQQQLDKMAELPLKFKDELKITDFDENIIYTLMCYDKKNVAGLNRFVLIRNFGELLLDVEANKSSILKSIKKTKKILV